MKVLVLILWTALALHGQCVRGTIVDGITRAPLPGATARMSDVVATADREGRVELCGPPGDATAAAAGYRTLRKRATENAEFALSPEWPAVLFGDPLRTLGAATSTDDFNARLSWRGAPMSVFTLDGVEMRQPLHVLRRVGNVASFGLLNADLTGSVTLVEQPSAAFDAPMVAVATRTPGSEWQGRVGANLVASTASAEGALSDHLAMLATVRKSHVEHLMRALGHPDLGLAFYDASARIEWDPERRHRVSILLTDATTGLNMDGYPRIRSAGTPLTADSRVDLGQAVWTWTPRAAVRLRSAVSQTLDRAWNRDAMGWSLLDSRERATAARHDAEFRSRGQALEAGGDFSRCSQRRFLQDPWDAPNRPLTAAALIPIADFDRTRLRAGAYVQETVHWSHWVIIAGGRVDHLDTTGATVFQPRASASYRLATRVVLSGSYAEYSRFPDADELFGVFANPKLRARRSRSVEGQVRFQVEQSTVVRTAFYSREDRRIADSEQMFWRIEEGAIRWPVFGSPLRDSLRTAARGIEATLEHRVADGLSGAITYGYGSARSRDDVTGARFDADFDQRHRLDAFAAWRPRPRMWITGRFRASSNIPVPGYYAGDASTAFHLSDRRNALRMPTYSTLDGRCSREWFRRGWRITLYGEISNLLNRPHYRYVPFNDSGFSVYSGWLTRDTMLPAVPSGGLTVDF